MHWGTPKLYPLYAIQVVVQWIETPKLVSIIVFFKAYNSVGDKYLILSGQLLNLFSFDTDDTVKHVSSSLCSVIV